MKIANTNIIKFVGVTVDNKLPFEEHRESIWKSAFFSANRIKSMEILKRETSWSTHNVAVTWVLTTTKKPHNWAIITMTIDGAFHNHAHNSKHQQEVNSIKYRQATHETFLNKIFSEMSVKNPQKI